MMTRNKFIRFFALISTAALLSLLITSAVAVSPGFDNFVYTDSYIDGQFRDVSVDDWFKPYVREATNLGIIRGRSSNSFDPTGLLTVGETVTLAARLRSIYHTGTANFDQSVPFYATYVAYALAHGIIEGHHDYTIPITRAQFAKIIRNTFPDNAFEIINDIPPFGINDVAYDTSVDNAIYSMFRAGILTGSDRFGTFFGGSSISRAEAAAIMVRLANPGARLEFSLPSYIPAEELFNRNTDAVFRIETFGPNFDYLRSGSGFFISTDGLAVTALHVIEGASVGAIETADGQVFRIAGIRAFDVYNNLAIIEIASDERDFRYLTVADSSLVETGNTVYALGSPRGMMNSISEGIISHTNRMQDEKYMLQFTAPISFGSGGGPILNSLGQVIGVASLSLTHGQNMNLAIPSNLIRELTLCALITLEEYRLSIYL